MKKNKIFWLISILFFIKFIKLPNILHEKIPYIECTLCPDTVLIILFDTWLKEHKITEF